MKRILEYVNLIFSELDLEIPEVSEAKDEMTIHLIDTVCEFKSEGRMENESIEFALLRFGDVADIKKEMNETYSHALLSKRDKFETLTEGRFSSSLRKPRVVLATGVLEIDRAIETRIRGFSFVGSAFFEDSLFDMASKREADIVILSEAFSHTLPIQEIIYKLENLQRFHSFRIIFIMKDSENSIIERFLYSHCINDILRGKFTVDELQEVLLYPKSHV